jgi:hypothetical protein
METLYYVFFHSGSGVGPFCKMQKKSMTTEQKPSIKVEHSALLLHILASEFLMDFLSPSQQVPGQHIKYTLCFLQCPFQFIIDNIIVPFNNNMTQAVEIVCY